MKTSTIEVGELVSTLGAAGVHRPSQKAEKIKALQDQGIKIGRIGDGINNAWALTQAGVGFPIGAGTDVAINALILKRTRLAGIQPAKPRGATTADATLATGASA